MGNPTKGSYTGAFQTIGTLLSVFDESAHDAWYQGADNDAALLCAQGGYTLQGAHAIVQGRMVVWTMRYFSGAPTGAEVAQYKGTGRGAAMKAANVLDRVASESRYLAKSKKLAHWQRIANPSLFKLCFGVSP